MQRKTLVFKRCVLITRLDRLPIRPLILNWSRSNFSLMKHSCNDWTVPAGTNPDSCPTKHHFSQRKPIPGVASPLGMTDDVDQTLEKANLRPCKGPPLPWVDSTGCRWATSTLSPFGIAFLYHKKMLSCITDHAELKYTADVQGRDCSSPKKGRKPKDQTLG